MDSQAFALMRAQGGIVTAEQLSSLGLTANDLRRDLATGSLVRVRRGAFVEGEAWQEADRDTRYRLTVEAVMRSRTTPDIATHHSALALHSLPLWHVDRTLVVMAGDVQETTTNGGLRISPHRALAGVELVRGLRTLPVADAIVTVGSRNVEAAVVAGDAALHTGRCTPEDLDEARDRLRAGLRGRARLDRTIALVDPLAESPGESRTRLVLAALDLPMRSQVEIRDVQGRLIARVDFLVADKVVLEFDGATKYAGADGRDALVAEKRREDQLRALGYHVIRVTWAELANPQQLLDRIRAAVLRSGA